MAEIHDKIRLAIKDLGHSVRSAAVVCGIKYRTLHSCLNDEREVSHSILEAISAGLDIDFGYFSNRSPKLSIDGLRSRNKSTDQLLRLLNEKFDNSLRKEAYDGNRVDLSSFLNWWVSNSGRLENFDQIANRVDLFDPPTSDSNLIQPTQIGPQSLATKYFDLKETGHLCKTIEGFTKHCNEQLVEAHLEALKHGEPVISHPELDETLRNGKRFAHQYRRVLAPVYLLDGTVKVVNYSEDIS
ncbi:MAG: helix-turn-helix transcriptional regulator [Sulfitobacter sp.]